MSKKITHGLPTRCIDPVMKCCQDCTWGYREYGDDVECSADITGCCFESGCTLGFDNAKLFGRYPNGKSRTWEETRRTNKDRAKVRSKTFSGIAQAMAEQWGTEEG